MIPTPSKIKSNSSFDFAPIKQESQRRLFKLLDKYEGTKTIIFDDKLIGPFEFVANASLLRQHEAVRLFRLNDIKSTLFNDIKTEYILIFLRKDYSVAKNLAELLQRSNRVTLSKTCLVFVPYKCASIERLLELNKVDLSKLGSIEQLKIQLFALDAGIISTENERVYADLYLRNDHSFAHQIADGLILLQEHYGQIPRITGQGKAAKIVCDLLLKHRKLHNRISLNSPSMIEEKAPLIQQLILIDRRVDLITPLVTQLTYEGLLDELFSISNGTITLPAEKFSRKPQEDDPQQQQQQQQQAPTKRIDLRSTEELFSRLRDCHTNAVADILKQSAKNLQAEYEECRREGKTIGEIGKIVKRLNYLKVAEKSQSNHVTMAELINEQSLKAEFIYGLRIEHELLQEERLGRINPEIEMKLLRQEPPLHVLRLICLQSIIANGLKSKVSDYYKREIVQNYGPKFIPYLLQLEKAKLLLSHERYYDIGSFSQLNNKLLLVRDDVDECNPNHFSYVYGGYSPISIAVTRILSLSPQHPKWRVQMDNLRFLPEPFINHTDLRHQQVTSLGGRMTSNDQHLLSSGTPSSLSSSAVSAAASIFLSSGVVPGPGGSSRVRRNSISSNQSSNEESKTVLVFFIGGCTMAEISALRFLSQQDNNNCEFLVGTTKIVNGRTFLNSLWPHEDEVPVS